MSEQTLANIPLEDIHIGKRFRVDLGSIDQLKYSIKKNGLISPIAIAKSENITDQADPTDQGNWELCR